jgi:DNA polymerase-3 subunit alpha
VAYQTAYLKANYPSEYMAALLSSNLGSIEKLELYMKESNRMGISVLSPDINESQMRFSANAKGDIRFGLAAIKGVGEGAVNAIIAEREKNGPYKNIYDFCERTNYTAVNRKCFENLAMAGGFDSIIDFPRGKFLALVDEKDESTFVDALVRYGVRIQAERSNAQQSLFGGDSGVVDIQKPAVPVRGDAIPLELLNKEKELIGMYLSAHPLDEYRLLIKSTCACSLADLGDLEKFRGKEIAVAGIVTDTREFYLKNGTPAGSMTVMDYNGSKEFRFFRKDYEMFRTRMFKDYFLLIQGRVQVRPYSNPEELEFKVTSVTQLSDVRDGIRDIKLYIPVEKLTHEFIDELLEVSKNSKGKAQLKFSMQDFSEDVYVSAYARKFRVSLTPELAQFIEKHNLKYTINVNNQ